MRFKTLLSAVLIFCFVGCFSDPADEIIYVIREIEDESGRKKQNLTVKVSDLHWEKQKGVWVSIVETKFEIPIIEGQPEFGVRERIVLKEVTMPADKEAVEAIEAFMKNRDY